MKSNFQTIILAVFLAFFVFGVLIFSGLLPIGNKSSKNNLVGTVEIWGTVPSAGFSKVIEDININNPNLSVKYSEKNLKTYSTDIIEAIANGTGPDLFMLPDDMIVRQRRFVMPIPYTSYLEKTFRDTFLDGAEVYLADDGIMALPLTVDPLVLYYNKDLLANNGISRPPVYWSELLDLNSYFTKSTTDGTISQSMIALGTYDNISHAKDILALLLIQNGNPIIKKDGGVLSSVLGDRLGQDKPPAQSVLEFYSQFSNPTNTSYSWNRGLINSKDYFTGGRLAFYIGHGSELFNIESINPNLSFDVANVLQTKGTNNTRTFASMNALAVSKSAKDPALAISTAVLFTDPAISKSIATALSLPPARRDLLAERPTDRYLTVFYNSAISARSWLDPNTALSDTVFRDMIQNIVSNKLDVNDAITKAQDELQQLARTQ